MTSRQKGVEATSIEATNVKEPIVIEYIGLNNRQWGPVPPRDLTQVDLDEILEKHGFTKENILAYGVGLYREIDRVVDKGVE